MNDRRDEQVALLDRMKRIDPSSREIGVIFDDTSSRDAWPEELTGTILNGLTDAEALFLISTVWDRAELYVTDPVNHRGNPRRYLLTELQKKEESGGFLFKATRGFDDNSVF